MSWRGGLPRRAPAAQWLTMNMQTYVALMSYAVERIIETIWHESNVLLEAARQRLTNSTALTNQAYSDMRGTAEGAPEHDERWSRWSGEEKIRIYDLIHFQEQQELINFSIQASAASLLQYAKQGISIVFKVGGNTVKNLRGGRSFNGEPIANVIWQARNQALHWEAGENQNGVSGELLY